jgi:hypothetical protein
MFVCTINPEESVGLDIVEDGYETLVRVPVGYCASTGCVYSLVVALTPLPATLTPELRFFIVEAQPDGSHIRLWWDGAESRGVIVDREHRRLIRYVLCIAVRHLIETVAPDAVEMMTRTPHLPKPALSKFYQIAGIFGQCGFDARRADGYAGVFIWMMRRRPI